MCIARASRSPTANSHARRRQLRRFSRSSPIAGASGSPTAKLEPRNDTRALLAPAAAKQRNSNPAATLTAFVHCSREQEPSGELARAPRAAASLQQGQSHCWRQRQPNGETRTPQRHPSLPRIASASGSPTAKLKPCCDTYSVFALLAPAGAQRRTRTRTQSKAPLDRGVGG